MPIEPELGQTVISMASDGTASPDGKATRSIVTMVGSYVSAGYSGRSQRPHHFQAAHLCAPAWGIHSAGHGLGVTEYALHSVSTSCLSQILQVSGCITLILYEIIKVPVLRARTCRPMFLIVVQSTHCLSQHTREAFCV